MQLKECEETVGGGHGATAIRSLLGSPCVKDKDVLFLQGQGGCLSPEGLRTCARAKEAGEIIRVNFQLLLLFQTPSA